MPETLKYDGPFDIATGRNRKETNWKNKEMLWSELVEKLRTTHRTAETIAEYATSKKPRQDEIKDIGGFVTGYLTGGRRKAANVLHKQVIALDMDNATPGFWLAFTSTYPNAAIVYSTHKHKPDEQRLRLLLMLDRPVRPDEYEAIARRIAGRLGIELFDPTTFQAERLMYWPSTSKDGEYVFKYQDGQFLCADNVLATYHDWKDSSAWPVSSRVDKLLQRSMAKQGDPLEKPQVVGAFCRTYSIHEAIEKYLPDVYDLCDIENRFTYKEGSTAAGLIIYDDKFAYSHHGTDPTSGKLCNAFDLVRIHKFGLKDEDAREGTPGNKLPSYTAMIDFARNDETVKQLIFTEKFAEAHNDFVDIAKQARDEAANMDWTKKLEVDRWCKPLSTIDNIYQALKNEAALQGVIYYDDFAASIRVAKSLPWRKLTEQTKDFTDSDEDCLSAYLEKHYKIPYTQVKKAISKILTEHTQHPIKDYLNAQQWDGRERLETLFIDYLGAENSSYIKAVTRKTFIAAVARVFEPGVKFDTVPTLIGKQGTGKSTIIAKMAKQWFSDCLGDIQKKEGMESIRGVWIMELAEMASLKKAEQEAIKRFITCREDMYRPPYGRRNIRFPRQCIFIGTTNKWDFLSDPTGNRRFLPISTLITVPTKNIFTDLTDFEINQLWAEAVAYYMAGESIDLSAELKEIAENIRLQHTVQDERTGMIEKYLDTPIPANWSEMSIYDRRSFLAGNEVLTPDVTVLRNAVCMAEIWCEVLGSPQKDLTSQNTKDLHNVLRNMEGWEPTKSVRSYGIYGKQRGYERSKKQGNFKMTAFTQEQKEVNAVNAM